MTRFFSCFRARTIREGEEGRIHEGGELPGENHEDLALDPSADLGALALGLLGALFRGAGNAALAGGDDLGRIEAALAELADRIGLVVRLDRSRRLRSLRIQGDVFEVCHSRSFCLLVLRLAFRRG